MDQVIDYKAISNLTDALLRPAPNGIDVNFDDVGGIDFAKLLTTLTGR